MLYLFTECSQELCTGGQSSWNTEGLVWYPLYSGTFLELYSLCTIYYNSWKR